MALRTERSPFEGAEATRITKETERSPWMALRTERSQWQRREATRITKETERSQLDGPKNGAEPMAKEGSHSDGGKPLDGPKNGEKPF